MKAVMKALLTISLVFMCSFVLHAQSGRRQTKPAPAAPIPTPTPEPTPTPKTENKDADLSFYVGVDRNHSYIHYPSSYDDAVLVGCAEGLRHSSADVDVTDRDLPRGDAIKKAKQSTKTYTVLLQLSEQNMSGGAAGNQQADQVEVEYVVFAPGTGKVVTSGRTYQQSNRQGPIVIGAPGGGSTSGLYREALLKRAGEDAGERILHALHLSVPQTH